MQCAVSGRAMRSYRFGTPERFGRGKQIGTYIGMIPTEDSSADKQRLGHHCQSSDASQDGHSLGLDVAKRLSIRHRSSSVRARDSSVPGMVCSKTSR